MRLNSYKNFVVRNIGDIIILVNITDNSIFEIDTTVQTYIQKAQSNDGYLEVKDFIEGNDKTYDEIQEELDELLETLNN